MNIKELLNTIFIFFIFLFCFTIIPLFLMYEIEKESEKEKNDPPRGCIIGKEQGHGGKPNFNYFYLKHEGKVKKISEVGSDYYKYDIGDYYCCCSNKCDNLKEKENCENSN